MKALLLLAFGGPRSLDEVEFLLTRLFRGRKPSAEQIGKGERALPVDRRCSPLPEITLEQAKSSGRRTEEKGLLV